MTAVASPVRFRNQFLRRGHALQRREPAMGYASRLAALAGVDLRTLLRDMRIDIRELARGADDAVLDLGALRGLRDADMEALVRYTPRRVLNDMVYSLAGNRLLSGSVLTRSTRVCPHCVAEDLERFEGRLQARPWQRIDWLVHHIRSCNRHGTMLLEVQPSERLHIGVDFSQTVARDVLPVLDRLRDEALPMAGGAYSDWILARMDGVRDPANWLDDASLHAGIAYCEALGVSMNHHWSVRPSSLSAMELARAADEGFLTASSGPEAITAALDQVLGANPLQRIGSPGQLRVYGLVYHVLSQTGDDPDFERFREVVREHAFARLPFKTGKSFLGGTLKERRVHTLRTAASAFSCADYVMNRMVAGLADPKSFGVGGNAGRIVIQAEELRSLVERMNEHLSTKDVAAATGLHVEWVGRLAEKGLLPTLPVEVRQADLRCRFLRADVDAFMARLFRGAQPVSGPEGRRMKLAKARNVARCLATEILELVHEERLSWVGRCGEGLRYENLLVDVDEVRAALAPQTKRPGLAPPTQPMGLTAIEAFAILKGVQKNSITRLAKAGLLACVREYRPECLRTLKLYTRESIDAFASEYVSLGEIASRTGIAPVQALRNLAGAGVAEALDFKSVGTMLYRRRDVLPHLALSDLATVCE